jgi:phosphoribosylanthranilate isomerase
MKNIIIQIYEIQTPQEAVEMARLGVDHMGSVVLSAPGEGADPQLAETVRAVQGAGAKSSLIPLFTQPDDICRVLDLYRPDIVHFCDSLCDRQGKTLDLSPFIALQKEIRAGFPQVRMMRSIPVGIPSAAHLVDTLAIARQLAGVSDFLLTDTWLGPTASDPVSGFIGITGKTCDWGVAAKLVEQSPLPVILAGGLGPENVYAAVEATRPAGVDSCTLTNKLDPQGKPIRFAKDKDKVADFGKNALAGAARVLKGK